MDKTRKDIKDVRFCDVTQMMAREIIDAKGADDFCDKIIWTYARDCRFGYF